RVAAGERATRIARIESPRDAPLRDLGALARNGGRLIGAQRAPGDRRAATRARATGACAAAARAGPPRPPPPRAAPRAPRRAPRRRACRRRVAVAPPCSRTQ